MCYEFMIYIRYWYWNLHFFIHNHRHVLVICVYYKGKSQICFDYTHL